MLFWFSFCGDIPGYVKFCDNNLCDDILISLWWYCGDAVIQPQREYWRDWKEGRGSKRVKCAWRHLWMISLRKTLHNLFVMKQKKETIPWFKEYSEVKNNNYYRICWATLLEIMYIVFTFLIFMLSRPGYIFWPFCSGYIKDFFILQKKFYSLKWN